MAWLSSMISSKVPTDIGVPLRSSTLDLSSCNITQWQLLKPQYFFNTKFSLLKMFHSTVVSKIHTEAKMWKINYTTMKILSWYCLQYTWHTSLVEICQCFGAACCLHLQDSKTTHAEKRVQHQGAIRHNHRLQVRQNVKMAFKGADMGPMEVAEHGQEPCFPNSYFCSATSHSLWILRVNIYYWLSIGSWLFLTVPL